MPYRQVYEPPPTNMSLKVHEELPEGYVERKASLFGRLREAHVIRGDKWLEMHFCPDCEGWIEGHANEYEVNTLNSRQLAGRRGREYYCRRCGYQIDFVGLMS